MKKVLLLFVLFMGLTPVACQTTTAPVLSTSANTPTSQPEPTQTATTEPTITPSPTPDPALNATLNEVAGSVEAKDLPESDFSTAADGRTIQEEGQVRTLEDGYTRVDLSTGTLIRMAPSSYFTLVENQPEEESLLTRIKLELGKIWVVLNGGSLEVETPSGQASVRGSYMMVEIDPETQEALVTCLEGNCRLENAAGILELTNGQRARLHPPDLPEGELHLPPIENMSERDFAEWLFFAPEAEQIFPQLAEEGLLPWDEWQIIIPEEDADFFSLLEELPDEPLLDGGLLPGDGSLLPGDGDLSLPGDGSLFPGGDDEPILPIGGDEPNLPAGGGTNLPGGGDNLPGGGSNLPSLP